MNNLNYEMQMDSKKFKDLKNMGFDTDDIYILQDEIKREAERQKHYLDLIDIKNFCKITEMYVYKCNCGKIVKSKIKEKTVKCYKCQSIYDVSDHDKPKLIGNMRSYDKIDFANTRYSAQHIYKGRIKKQNITPGMYSEWWSMKFKKMVPNDPVSNNGKLK